MDPSTSTSPAPHTSTRGWDLPEEILHAIMSCIDLRTEDEYAASARRTAKHALTAPSLVNKYWSTAILPLLFRAIALHSLDDARFLQDMVRSPALATSGLAIAIKSIHVWYTTPLAKPWAYDVHWLMARLPHTIWVFAHGPNEFGDGAPTLALSNPFASIPVVPSSFLRFTALYLDRVRFASCAELVKLIDNFYTLRKCACSKLSFVDPTPYLPPTWRQQQTVIQRPLWYCCIVATEGMTLAAQAVLVSDILRAAVRLDLDDTVWKTVLEGMVSLVPQTWEQLTLELIVQDGTHFDRASIGFSRHDRLYNDDAVADIYVRRAATGSNTSKEPSSAYVQEIMLDGSFPGMQTIGITPLDAIYFTDHAAVSRLEEVNICARESNKDGMKKVLCGVLRRTQLTWALDSGLLSFQQLLNNRLVHVLDSAEILSVPAEHTVDDKPLTLTVPEQAEWLLLRTPAEKDAYLRRLPALRAAALLCASAATPVDTDSSADRGQIEDDESREV